MFVKKELKLLSKNYTLFRPKKCKVFKEIKKLKGFIKNYINFNNSICFLFILPVLSYTNN